MSFAAGDRVRIARDRIDDWSTKAHLRLAAYHRQGTVSTLGLRRGGRGRLVYVTWDGNKEPKAVPAEFVERVPDDWAVEPATTG